jgi:hypothetical protein
MKYAVEMVLCCMVHIPNFIKIGSGVQSFVGILYVHTRRYIHRTR